MTTENPYAPFRDACTEIIRALGPQPPEHLIDLPAAVRAVVHERDVLRQALDDPDTVARLQRELDELREDFEEADWQVRICTLAQTRHAIEERLRLCPDPTCIACIALSDVLGVLAANDDAADRPDDFGPVPTAIKETAGRRKSHENMLAAWMRVGARLLQAGLLENGGTIDQAAEAVERLIDSHEMPDELDPYSEFVHEGETYVCVNRRALQQRDEAEVRMSAVLLEMQARNQNAGTILDQAADANSTGPRMTVAVLIARARAALDGHETP
jgi:hypothetical protein